jgi:L-threonylcarbamoyladenylate synthase
VEITENIKFILEKSLPGPYTFLVKKRKNVNPLLTANSEIVGIRIPDNMISYKLTEEFPITSTSANISNNPTPNNINDIKNQLGDNIHTYIDYGVLENNKPSTIIDLTRDRPKIVRKGLANQKLIHEILKVNL